MLTQLKRPYVILNVAMTADGKTDTVSRSGASISSKEDMERVDQLRAEVDAVMVGGRALLNDDPRLTVKSEKLRQERLQRGLSPDPIKNGVVTRANLKPESRFLTFGPARVMIFTTPKTEPAEIEMLQKLRVKVFILGEQRVDLPAAMHQLWREGIQQLLVEGGGTLNEELLHRKLVDEINIYVAPLIFGGKNAPTFADGQGLNSEMAIRLHITGIDRLADGGIVLHYLPGKA